MAAYVTYAVSPYRMTYLEESAARLFFSELLVLKGRGVCHPNCVLVMYQLATGCRVAGKTHRVKS